MYANIFSYRSAFQFYEYDEECLPLYCVAVRNANTLRAGSKKNALGSDDFGVDVDVVGLREPQADDALDDLRIILFPPDTRESRQLS